MKCTNKSIKIEDIILIIILVIGILVRIIGIADIPNAFNCDEASSGYEAFSLLNYGIDRNGNHNPSFLVCLGKRTKCFINIFNNSFYKSIRVDRASNKTTYGNIGMYFLNCNVFIIKENSQ